MFLSLKSNADAEAGKSKLKEPSLASLNFQLCNGFVQTVRTCCEHLTTLKLIINKLEYGLKPEKK